MNTLFKLHVRADLESGELLFALHRPSKSPRVDLPLRQECCLGFLVQLMLQNGHVAPPYVRAPFLWRHLPLTGNGGSRYLPRITGLSGNGYFLEQEQKISYQPIQKSALKLGEFGSKLSHDPVCSV